MTSLNTETHGGNGVDLIPDEIDFTNADVERDLVRPKLRGGTVYWGKCTSAKKAVWPKGKIYLEMVWNPMDSTGKTRGPSTRYKLTLPFANPNKLEAGIPNTLGFCHNFLNALYPAEFPRFPRYNKVDGTFVTEDGQAVDKATAGSLERQIVTKVRAKIKEYWSNPQSLVNEIGFMLIKDDEYREVEEVYSEAPPGVDVCMSDFAASVG